MVSHLDAPSISQGQVAALALTSHSYLRVSSMPSVSSTYRMVMAAARLIQRRQNDALAPLKMTRAAVIALEATAPRPLNQEQLAAKVHVQSQTLGRVLARLEAAGLVTRTRNPEDRRQLRVHLTAAGEAALAAARQAEIDAFPSAMDAQDWRILQEQLGRFVDALKVPHQPRRRRRTEPAPEQERAHLSEHGASQEVSHMPHAGSADPHGTGSGTNPVRSAPGFRESLERGQSGSG